MSEERSPVEESPSVQPDQASSVPAESPQVETPVPETPAWRAALEEAPIEELRQHPRFKGMLGSELETRRIAWQQSEVQRIGDEQRAALEAELLNLAENDPDELARRFKTDTTQRRQQQDIANLRSGARDQIARQIGEAFRALPEWAELTAADHEEFHRALAGKNDDQVLAVFNQKATEKIAAIRASKASAAWQSTEREKVVAAVRLEEQNKLLQGGDRPDIGRVRGTGAISEEPNWRTEPQRWNAWYAKSVHR